MTDKQEKKHNVRLKKSPKNTTKEVLKKNLVSEVKTKDEIKLKVPQDSFYATGRRKSSTAKVWLFKGTGKVIINKSLPLDYLGIERLVKLVNQPIKVLDLINKYDIRIDINGGGLTGQAQAANLGVARALLKVNDDYRATLREYGCLTQDSREKERKKYGKRGARKSPQYRKR